MVFFYFISSRFIFVNILTIFILGFIGSVIKENRIVSRLKLVTIYFFFTHLKLHTFWQMAGWN